VMDAQFTPDGSTLVAAARDGTLHGYDLATGVETEIGRSRRSPRCWC